MSLRETCAVGRGRRDRQLARSHRCSNGCAKRRPWLGDMVAALIAERTKSAPTKRWAGHRLLCSRCNLDLSTRAPTERHGACTSANDLATAQVDQLES